MRCGGPELCSECAADAYRARAALAQPSPAQVECIDCHGSGFCMSISNEEIRCPCRAPIKFSDLAQAEQAEAERPEVVAWRYGFSGGIVSDTACLDEWKSGGEYQSLMTVAQHARIVGALRFERQQMDRAFTACINERDAAQARCAELKAELAMANDAAAKGAAARHQCGGMEMEIKELRGAAAHWEAESRALQKQRDAALANVDALAAQVLKLGGTISFANHRPAQAQHSVPEGWKLVPMDPTSQMTFVGQSLRYDAVNSIGEIYRQMVAAAPGKEGL